MPTREEIIAELEREDMIHELESQDAGGYEGFAQKAVPALKGGFQDAANAIGKGLAIVDSYTGAPVRSGISEYQKTGDFGGAVSAAANQFGIPTGAPSGKDLAAQAGIPTTEYNTGLVLNPFNNETLKVSPAGLVGGGIESLADPTFYLGLGTTKGLVKAGTSAVGALAKPVAQSAVKHAELQAAKAATGQSVRHMRKMAKMSGQGAADIGRAEGNIRDVGRRLLAEDDAGGPVIGMVDRVEDIGEKAAAKQKFYGKQIGKVASTIDEALPEGSVDLRQSAIDLLDYAETIPDVGKGKRLKERILQEAADLEGQGVVTFEQAKVIKNQYQYKPMDPDILFSDSDITNKIRSSVASQQDRTVSRIIKNRNIDKLVNSGELEFKIARNSDEFGGDQVTGELLKNGESVARIEGILDPRTGEFVANRADTIPSMQGQGLGSYLAKKVQNGIGAKKIVSGDTQTPAGKALMSSVDQRVPQEIETYILEKYPEIKSSYGAMKQANEAASSRSTQNLVNRIIPPSSYMLGGANLAGELAKGTIAPVAMLKSAALAAANKVGMQRGSAFIARSLNGLSKAAEAVPEKLVKYDRVLQGAAGRGTQALIAAHHLLMNNDSEYRNIIENYSGEETE